MNPNSKDPDAGEALRAIYPVGARIELISMTDDPRAVLPGTRGTVKGIDGAGSILMRWDSGSSLSLVPGADVFRVLLPGETEEEKMRPDPGCGPSKETQE